MLGLVALSALGLLSCSASPKTEEKIKPIPESPLMQSETSQSLAYRLRSDSQGKAYAANTPLPYSFFITHAQGEAVKDFALTHTKPMHVIVVRRDLSSFQHLHPNFDEATGQFSLSELRFPEEGEYRLFADFSVLDAGKTVPLTLWEDLTVGETYEQQPLGSEEKSKVFNGIQATLSTHGPLVAEKESMLMFSLSENGVPVTDLQEYLGALGHTVILKEGTLDFTHTHPLEAKEQNGVVSFMVHFPSSGKYKAFTQFQREGKVFLTEFVLAVAEEGEEKAEEGFSEMDHEGMGH